MRVLVCGSRTYTEAEFDFMGTLMEGLGENYHRFGDPVTIIHGAAPGADSWANASAEAAPLPIEAYPADWDTYGKRAGYVRNVEMLNAKPDVVIAFVDKPLEESKGTAMMVDLAMKEGVPTYVVRRM